MPHPAQRLARWLVRLQIFDFEIEYRPGKENGAADGLSRICEEITNSSDERTNDEDDVILVNVIHIRGDLINVSQLEDENIKWAYEMIRDKVITVDRENLNDQEKRSYFAQRNRLMISGNNLFRRWEDENGFVRFQYVVPKAERPRLLDLAHSSVYACHLGCDKILNRIKDRFYWPGYAADTEKYVRECLKCQLIKAPHQYSRAALKPLLPAKPWAVMTSDFVGPLPKTARGNKACQVIVDHFSKYVEVYPCPDMLSKTAANNFMSTILRHGVPEVILCNQGRQFQSELMAELYAILDIDKKRTTPYHHPQTDGLSERFIGIMQKMIATVVDEDQSNWDTRRWSQVATENPHGGIIFASGWTSWGNIFRSFIKT